MVAGNGRQSTIDPFFYRNPSFRLHICEGDNKHPSPAGYAESNLHAADVEQMLEEQNCDRYCWLLDSNALVVDIDRHQGGADGMLSLARLNSDLGIDLIASCKAVCRTGGDGLHLIFSRHPELKLKGLDRNKYPGIDIIDHSIKSNALIICAGSSHPSGNRYQWISDNPELADAPAELLELLRVEEPVFEGAGGGGGADEAETPGDRFSRSQEGVQKFAELLHEKGYQFRLCDGFYEYQRAGKSSGSRISGYLGKVNRHGRHQWTNFSLADPYLESGETVNLLEGLRRVLADGKRDGGWAPVMQQLAAWGFGMSTEEMFSAVADLGPRMQSAANLIATYPTPAPAVFDGLVREGDIMNLVAGPKIGKTMLAYSAVQAILRGSQWLGQFPAVKGDVMVIDGELDPREFSTRLQKLGLTQDELERLQVRYAADDDEATLASLLDEAERTITPATKIVIIDPIYVLLPDGANENLQADMGPALRQVRRFAAKHSVCVLIVHHTSKGDQSQKAAADVGAGSGVISRIAGCHMTLLPHAKGQGLAVAEAICRSFPQVDPFTLQFKYPVWVLSEEPPEKQKAGAAISPQDRAGDELRVFSVISEATRILSARRIIDASGVPRSRAIFAIESLVRQGQIELVEGGAEYGRNQFTDGYRPTH